VTEWFERNRSYRGVGADNGGLNVRTQRTCDSILVQALFLDFDGTISPLGVPRSESRVSSENMAVLCQISRKIPVTVITTKDLAFVVNKTPFAHAWAGSGGLEIKIGQVVTKEPCLRRMKNHIIAALKYAKRYSDSDLIIEEKHDSEGATIAFSVDWRQVQGRYGAEEMALKIISYCETLPIETIKYEGQPFFDVFPCKVDKGKTLLKLKQKLGLPNGILYMGDSIIDNPAFKAADIGVGVIHEETPDTLVCEYFVKFEDMTVFFHDLLKSHFHFNPKSPMILNRTQAFQHTRRRKT
jgi:HAD superfamily hydrolase (TIGR01484 family)